MIARKGVVFVLCVLALVLVAPTAVAQDGVDVSVSVDGETVSDGAEVEVSDNAEIEIEVSSDSALEYVTMEYNGSFRSVGAQDETEFNTTRELNVHLGSSTFMVEAANANGDTATHTVTLVRAPSSGRDYRDVVDRLSRRVDNLNDSNRFLQERHRNLSTQNEELRNETQRLRQQVNESEGGGNGLPGFGVPAALIALAFALVVGLRRKR